MYKELLVDTGIGVKDSVEHSISSCSPATQQSHDWDRYPYLSFWPRMGAFAIIDHPERCETAFWLAWRLCKR